MISPQLQAAFRADGFVHIPAFVDAGGLVALEAAWQRVLPRLAELPPARVFHEDPRDPATLKQVQHVEDLDATFAELLAGPGHALAEALLGAPAVPRNLQYFNKPPGANRPTPPHQDGYYFRLQPCVALTAWLALDAADEANGVVRYVRGSHTHGLRAHASTTTLGFSLGLEHGLDDADRAAEHAPRARPGDLLVHDARTVHFAQANAHAHRQRRALGLIYYASHAREDRAANDAYQRELAERLERSGRI